MIASPIVMEWLRDDPLPAVLPDPVIVFGGTRLLAEFVHAAATFSGGALAIAVPFARHGVAGECLLWDALFHRDIDLTVITAGNRDAQAVVDELGVYPWKSLLVRVRSRLHTKLYARLAPDGGGVCLVGSHNLTRRGARGNHESGTLFVSRRDQAVGGIVRACHDHIAILARGATTFHDTLGWPTGPA
jgi:hypothetical protein